MTLNLLEILNLLLVPMVGLLIAQNRQLAAIATTQQHHAEQLAKLDHLPAAVSALQALSGHSWHDGDHHQPPHRGQKATP